MTKRKLALEKWALFRLKVVRSLLRDPPRHGKTIERMKTIAGKKWNHPITGKWIRISFLTILCWYNKVQWVSNPLAALGNVTLQRLLPLPSFQGIFSSRGSEVPRGIRDYLVTISNILPTG